MPVPRDRFEGECLVKLVFPCPGEPVSGARALIQEELQALGPPRGEALTGVVFILAAAAWVLRQPLAGMLGLVDRPAGAPAEYLLTDAGIAMIAALLLFTIPVDARSRTFLLEWKDTARLPWGRPDPARRRAYARRGVWAERRRSLYRRGVRGALGAPGAGRGRHRHRDRGVHHGVRQQHRRRPHLPADRRDRGGRSRGPPYLLIFPTALAASYAFMMPMGTPPNALAFASGHLRVPDMAKAGFLLNLLSILVITLFIYYAAPVLLGFDIAGGLTAKGP